MISIQTERGSSFRFHAVLRVFELFRIKNGGDNVRYFDFGFYKFYLIDRKTNILFGINVPF